MSGEHREAEEYAAAAPELERAANAAEPQVPVRAYRFMCHAHADTREDLAGELRAIADSLEYSRITGLAVSGGSRSGSKFELLIEPDQTHEKYFAELQRYLGLKPDRDADSRS